MLSSVLLALTLTAGFSDDTAAPALAPEWTTFYGAWDMTLTETGGRLHMTSSDNNSTKKYAGYVGAGAYDLRNGSVRTELVSAGDQSVGGWQVMFDVKLDGSNRVEWLIEAGKANAIRVVNGSFSRPASVAYSSTNMRWLRIRHSEATAEVFREYSADNVTWNVLYSQVEPFAFTAMIPELKIGTTTALPVREAIWDNFLLVDRTDGTTQTASRLAFTTASRTFTANVCPGSTNVIEV